MKNGGHNYVGNCRGEHSSHGCAFNLLKDQMVEGEVIIVNVGV